MAGSGAGRSRAAALALGLLACACSDDSVTGPSVLVGSQWKLHAVATSESGTTVTVDPARYTVEFSDDGRLRARADCNVCVSGYSGLSRVLTIDRLACTRAVCPPDSRGNDYVALLNETRLYEVAGDTLTIVSTNGILYYRR